MNIVKRAETGGAEAWLARLNMVIRTYRGTQPPVTVSGLSGQTITVAAPQITLEQALAELRKFHLTEGDAMRYLRGKQK